MVRQESEPGRAGRQSKCSEARGLFGEDDGRRAVSKMIARLVRHVCLPADSVIQTWVSSEVARPATQAVWEQLWERNPATPRTPQIFNALSTVRGGAEGDRTPDLSSAIAALSHLSYCPTLTEA